MPPSALTSPKKKKKPLTAPKGPRPRKPASEAPLPTEPKTEVEDTKSSVKPPLVQEQKEIKKEEDTGPQKEESVAQPPSVPKPNPVEKGEKESTYTSIYSKKIVPRTGTEWTKLKTSCAMMLSSGTKGTSKVSVG